MNSYNLDYLRVWQLRQVVSSIPESRNGDLTNIKGVEVGRWDEYDHAYAKAIEEERIKRLRAPAPPLTKKKNRKKK